MTTQYVVVGAESGHELSTKVGELLAEGWQVVPSFQVVAFGTAETCKLFYYQPMIFNQAASNERATT